MHYDAEVRELPAFGLLNLRACDAARSTLAGALGFHLPERAHSTSMSGHILALWLGPDEWLLRTRGATEDELMLALRRSIAGRHADVTRVSDAYVALEVTGHGARDVLCQGAAIDLHPQRLPTGSCARIRFAKTRIVLHVVEAGRVYHLYVARSYSDYLAKWLQRACGE